MTAGELNAVAEANRLESGRQAERYVRRLNATRRPPLRYEETAKRLLSACASLLDLDLEGFIAETARIGAHETNGDWTLPMSRLAAAALDLRDAGVAAAKVLAARDEC